MLKSNSDLLLSLLLALVLCSSQVHSHQQRWGQLILAYYSGVSLETVGSGGLNALSLAFFTPTAMVASNCNFQDPLTPCLAPASGSGPDVGLRWALATINTSLPMLRGNTAQLPTVFFAFGGQSEGGVGWDTIFGSSGTAITFAQNCGNLVQAVYSLFGGNLNVGIDLDVEGTTTTLPHFGDFVKPFRELAPATQFPLMLDALSGLASVNSSDHYKVALLQNYGPSFGGINFLNMMVNNVQSSCATMSTYWRDPALDFIPSSDKVLGFWGENLAAWILQNPGCTDGTDPLFPWMKKVGAGMGIWQWWSGSTTDITAVIDQIRQD